MIMDKIYDKFRIQEFEDYFTIDKLFIESQYFSNPFQLLFVTPKQKEIWRRINLDGYQIGYYNSKSDYKFKTKEDCLKWIENYKKYPIIHEL